MGRPRYVECATDGCENTVDRTKRKAPGARGANGVPLADGLHCYPCRRDQRDPSIECSAGRTPLDSLDDDVGMRVLARCCRSVSGYVFTRKFSGPEHRGARYRRQDGHLTMERRPPKTGEWAYVPTAAGRKAAEQYAREHPGGKAFRCVSVVKEPGT